MDTIEEKIRAPLRALWDVALFDHALLFITALLGSVLLFMLVRVELYLALAPAGLAAFAYYARSRRSYDPVRSIERGNPALKEKLSAAYDNRQRENIIVKELVKEVSRGLDSVNTSVFLDRGRTNTYVFASIVIVFILLFLLSSGFQGVDLGGLMGGGGGGGGSQGGGSGSGGGGGSSQSGSAQSSQEESVGQGGGQDIYGDSSIARIEGQDLELEIHPEYGETEDFDSESAAEAGAVSAGFAEATAAETYTENIPAELEGTVRKYFEKLAED